MGCHDSGKVSGRLAATVLTVALALGIAGCSGLNISSASSARGSAVNDETARPSETASPEEEAAAAAAKAIKGKSIGDPLTAEQAKAVQHNWQGDAMAYPNADGSFTLIDRTEPLPDNVKVDAGARATGAANAAQAAGDPMNGAVNTEIKSLETATGRSIALVVRVNTFMAPAYESKGWVWMSPAMADGQQYSESASALAATQAWVAQQSSPGDWAIIVSQ
jgi:hypothetical protein